jgi:hypothetical protein
MTLRRALIHVAVLSALAAPLLAPLDAHATVLQRASAYETPERKGFYGEIALRPGAVVLRDGLVPAVRHHFTFGAGLTDRFKLGMSLQVGGYFGLIKKPVLGMDVLATGYLWRGMYLRAGFGVVNRLPLRIDSSNTAPGYGGTVGLGYEWTVKKTAGVGFGADFDARLIAAHEVRQTFTVGLHFHFH